MLWLLLLACVADEPSGMDTAPPPELTQASAEDSVTTAIGAVDEGYACRTGYYYVLTDEGHLRSTYRLGASVRDVATDPSDPPEAGDRVEVDVRDHSVLLVEGSCVYAPGCTDNIVVDCDQELDRRWVGTGGTLVLEHTPSGVKGEIVDLELTEADAQLTPRDGGATVFLPVVELPEQAYWE